MYSDNGLEGKKFNKNHSNGIKKEFYLWMKKSKV